MTNSVLLTVSGTIPPDIDRQIATGSRPRADYLAIADGLQADILDHAKARTMAGFTGRLLERLGGPNLLLAHVCWTLRRNYATILTDGEQVGIPLACLFLLTPRTRAHHAMIVHILSVGKKMFILDWLNAHTCIDRFLVYSSFQKRFIEERWKIPSARVIWTPFMVDDAFFAPRRAPPRPTPRPQICAVGLERRDYPTLLEAVAGLEVDVVIAAASPWSKYKDTTSGQSIPSNVTIKKFTQYELRQLYADSSFLVMPLEAVDFQAGVTAILEAMAMAKPVICSRVPGQTDVIVDDVNGRYVPPGDANSLRAEIERLLDQPAEAQRLGAAARELIEREMNLDHYVGRLARILIGGGDVACRTAASEADDQV